MIVSENVPLSTHTTLRVGGTARFFIECESKEDIQNALAFALEHGLLWSVLGEGSNVLAGDDVYNGVVIAIRIPGIAFVDAGEEVQITAGAGVAWDALVLEAARCGLWGLENLAGIPGTVGAAPVQNIGAYGAEVKDTLKEVSALDTRTGQIRILVRDECAFGYRDSIFKFSARFVILSVTFCLQKAAQPSIEYKDLKEALAQGTDLSTPASIGNAVRTIRGRKFPDLSLVGTAGSFFKNPTISEEAYASLKEKFSDMPGFPNARGVKIPTAFILDHMLGLRGYTEGNISLFENQPLVLVARNGATQKEIDTFANNIAARVHDATGIFIEREVRNFPT
ncbi:MAG: UDP-N-acetylenolpyruvoylglucosamine reductase [Patescibacteria group bacterium]|nr:UDP-N-acetylenolpyruvoylglucosamine reductase [Patescibacteria group bacterium]